MPNSPSSMVNQYRLDEDEDEQRDVSVKDLFITVDNPESQVTAIETFVMYRVVTKVRMSGCTGSHGAGNHKATRLPVNEEKEYSCFGAKTGICFLFPVTVSYELTRQMERFPNPLEFISCIHLGKFPQKTFGKRKSVQNVAWKVIGDR